jgi:hypothetical protein
MMKDNKLWVFSSCKCYTCCHIKITFLWLKCNFIQCGNYKYYKYIYILYKQQKLQTYFSRRWLFFVHILYGTFIMSSADMSGMNWDGTNVMLLHINNNFKSFKKWKLHFTSIAFWRKSIIVISNSCENYINFYHILLTIPSFYMSFYTIHICYITIIKELHTLR